MKRVILIALAIGGMFLNQTNAQVFSLSKDTTTAFTGGAVDVHNTVLNPGNDTLKLNWNADDQFLATGWDITGVCDINLCYNWAGDVQTGATKSCMVNPGTNMDFKVQFDASSATNGSSSYVTFRYVDVTNHITKYATYIATKVPTGINVTRADGGIALYPNPAKDDLNVIFDGNLGVKNIAIYNMIGKIVSIYKVNGNSARMNVSNIPSGIYFVRLLDSQGRVVATRKFTRQ